MNGVEGGAFSTIHITPEDGFSYASLELCGYPAHTVDPSGIIAKVSGSSTLVRKSRPRDLYCLVAIWGRRVGEGGGGSKAIHHCRLLIATTITPLGPLQALTIMVDRRLLCRI